MGTLLMGNLETAERSLRMIEKGAARNRADLRKILDVDHSKMSKVLSILTKLGFASVQDGRIEITKDGREVLEPSRRQIVYRKAIENTTIYSDLKDEVIEAANNGQGHVEKEKVKEILVEISGVELADSTLSIATSTAMNLLEKGGWVTYEKRGPKGSRLVVDGEYLDNQMSLTEAEAEKTEAEFTPNTAVVSTTTKLEDGTVIEIDSQEDKTRIEIPTSDVDLKTLIDEVSNLSQVKQKEN